MMADFKPRIEAWTRYSQAALNALVSASPQIDPKSAALRASAYADEMLKQWLEKAPDLNSVRPNVTRYDEAERPE